MDSNEFADELSILKEADDKLNSLFNFMKHPDCSYKDTLEINRNMVASAKECHLPKYEVHVIKEIGSYISSHLNQKYLPLDNMLNVSLYMDRQIYELKRRF